MIVVFWIVAAFCLLHVICSAISDRILQRRNRSKHDPRRRRFNDAR